MPTPPFDSKRLMIMSMIAPSLDEILDNAPFALFVFVNNRANYISNCKKEELLLAMREFIASSEGRLFDLGETKQ
jgi:hypothetical protein